MDLKPLIDKAITKAGGTPEALGEALGVSRTSIQNWQATGSMKTNNFLRLLSFIGGDIERALPEYQPDRASATVTVYGEVSASSAVVSEEVREEIDAFELNWKRSRAWTLTTGPVVYLRVRGDSMSPAYPEGSLIACRAPHTPGMTPQGWPVVLQDNDNHEQTFKLFYTIRGDRGRPMVLGVPINPAHHPVPFPNRAIINYLVLGKIEPYDGAIPEPLSGMLLREAG